VSYVHDLAGLPMFRGIAEAQLAELLTTFKTVKREAGTVLFRPGDTATCFEVLTKGEVTIEEDGVVRFQLRAPAPIGELGAFTGIPRSTKAVAAEDIELLSIPIGDLLGFFDRNAELGLAFSKNLLGYVSEKLRRDRRMLGGMRANVIRTQKAMKQMRDVILENAETQMSHALFQTLDSLIDNNRRANYRVAPPESFASQVRLATGRLVRVMELSEGYLKLEGTAKDIGADTGDFTAVLVMPGGEILVSGTVQREGEGGVVMKLDPMIDAYKTTLDDYVTRVQLLDFVV
jgi:CRP/FNR family cyclic AMP-dependent transcriptional regulator